MSKKKVGPFNNNNNNDDNNNSNNNNNSYTFVQVITSLWPRPLALGINDHMSYRLEV